MLLSELIPWKARRLDVETPPRMWAFNPSIVRHLGRTLCSVRLANYHMPGGAPAQDNPPRAFSKCALLELDDSLATVRQCIVDERDLGGRFPSNRVSRGFEDYRLFTVRPDDAKIHASASSACTSELSIIELCHLELEESREDWAFELAEAKPMRGEWSRTHQKNWMPYVDHPSGEPRWLFSAERGGLHSPNGRIEPLMPELAKGVEQPVASPWPVPRPRRGGGVMSGRGGTEAKLIGGRRLESARGQATHGRVNFSLRGGTQLVRVPGTETWLGLAHGYRGEGDRKFYWHAFIGVDERGTIRGTSKPFKLCSESIEFAAGLVIDASSRQIAVSYGVDDDTAWAGVAPLDAVLELMPEGIFARTTSLSTEEDKPRRSDAPRAQVALRGDPGSEDLTRRKRP